MCMWGPGGAGGKSNCLLCHASLFSSADDDEDDATDGCHNNNDNQLITNSWPPR